MNHLNIEFGHIYADEKIGEEHKKNVNALLDYLDRLLTAQTYCLSILIDEYHPKTSSLILTDYIDYLEKLGARPHYVVMEGDLRPLAYRLLYDIPKDMRRSLNKWTESRDKFPCALLAATWYLVRLNAFNTYIPKLVIGNVNVKLFGETCTASSAIVLSERLLKSMFTFCLFSHF